MAGGGYILSKKALEKFVTKLMHDEKSCQMHNEGSEDKELGLCLQNSTLFVDERDELMQKRFFPAGVEEHLNKREENNSYWYDQMLYYDSKYGGLQCCSDVPIGFHYVEPKEMFLMDYLIYRVHPYGFDKNLTETLQRKKSFEEILSASDIDSNATEYQKHEFYHNFEVFEKFKR
jgi:glycoprotein-N-acetylgalactosamine 3-beta-galactosyltransferase